MPEQGFEEPYKPYDRIELHSPDSNIRVPLSDTEVLTAAKQAYSAKGESILSEGYKDLEADFNNTYERQYSEGVWIDVVPQRLDFLYQQFGLKKDEQLGRTGFNSFGLFIPSYLEGLRTMGVREGYLGSGGWKHVVKDNYRSLLLGCSSITTAEQFFAFSKAVNPNMLSIVTDINPLAVNLAREAWQPDNINNQVIQSDAQNIPLQAESIDFIATNFLVPNLVDIQGSGKDTLKKVLSEAARVLSKEGRLVMIEQLDRIDLEWLSHWAHEEGLTFDHASREDRGILHSTTSLNDPKEVSRVIDEIPGFIRSSADTAEYSSDSVFRDKPREYFDGHKVDNVTTLIFGKKKHDQDF